MTSKKRLRSPFVEWTTRTRLIPILMLTSPPQNPQDLTPEVVSRVDSVSMNLRFIQPRKKPSTHSGNVGFAPETKQESKQGIIVAVAMYRYVWCLATKFITQKMICNCLFFPIIVGLLVFLSLYRHCH